MSINRIEAMSKSDGMFPIGYISRKTGLSQHVIRVWERRYAAVTPRRSTGNRRLYSQKDLSRLLLLQKAVSAGQNISNAVKLDNSELIELVGSTNKYPEPLATSEERRAPSDGSQAFVERCVSAVLTVESRSLESVLRDAAVDLSRLSLMEDVVSVLFQKIGLLWSEGSIRIMQEHMASNIVHGFLWDLYRSALPEDSAPVMVIATPSGQWCQIGALMACVAASDAGWEVHYFGPNLPAEEIASSAKQTDAEYVALGLSYSGNPGHTIRELEKLRKCLPPHVEMGVGGSAAAAYRDTLKEIGAYRFRGLKDFSRALGQQGFPAR